MYNENEKRTTTETTTTASSSSTRVRAYACAREDQKNEALAQISFEEILRDHQDILSRPMPQFTQRQLFADLEAGTPGIYYRYALQETASAPMPSWRYVLAIVARLKRQQIPPEDLLWI